MREKDENGQPRKRLPLWNGVGYLNSNTVENQTDNVDGFDKQGMAVSIYFRLLKSLIIFFSVAAVLTIPSLLIYGKGKASDDLNTS